MKAWEEKNKASQSSDKSSARDVGRDYLIERLSGTVSSKDGYIKMKANNIDELAGIAK